VAKRALLAFHFSITVQIQELVDELDDIRRREDERIIVRRKINMCSQVSHTR
jgi:hypothetical protein